jgi:hypothetical protein
MHDVDEKCTQTVIGQSQHRAHRPDPSVKDGKHHVKIKLTLGCKRLIYEQYTRSA